MEASSRDEESPLPTWMVIIASIDPDTGESTRDVYEVTPAPAPGTEHAVLVLLVTGIHPDAVERSGGEGAVSFADGERVISASFEIDGTPGPAPAAPDQGSLFDA